MIQYTRDDLDARIKKLEPDLNNRSDFSTLRDNAYEIVIGEYLQELFDLDDDFIRASNLASPLTTGGSPTINTDIGDLYELTLDTDHLKIAGDTIFVQKSTTYFSKVSRMTLAEIITGGDDETIIGFIENNGKLILYVKDGEFTPAANVCYFYYRQLETAFVDGDTVLDIKAQDFNSIASRVTDYMINA